MVRLAKKPIVGSVLRLKQLAAVQAGSVGESGQGLNREGFEVQKE